MGKHIWGYWDCPYCDSKGIRGDNRSCPFCGAPVQPGIKYYMKEGVLEEVAEPEKNDAANWICEYCDAQNDARDEFCRNCGSPREEAKRNYFTALPPAPPPSPPQPLIEQPRPSARRRIDMRKTLRKVAMCTALIVFIFWLFTPITRSSKIDGFKWERSIAIEEYKNVDESDWTLPKNANLHRTAEEIHHYNQVLDHYETKTRKVSHREQDGYDTHYKDLGNGQFEEVKTPRYKTVYKEETYREPVYRKEPVYRTKYYYDIDKWVKVDSVDTKNDDHEPYWGETGLNTVVPTPSIGDRREGDRTETYYAVVKDVKGKSRLVKYDLGIWKGLSVGDKITYKTFRFSQTPLNI